MASVLLDDDEAGDTDELGELMTAHRARKPEDPWLDYYEGLLRLNNDDDPTAAETVLAAGIVKVTSDDDREAFRSALVGARLRAGWARFHGPWLLPFLFAGTVRAGQPGVRACSRVIAVAVCRAHGQLAARRSRRRRPPWVRRPATEKIRSRSRLGSQ